jgi:hypothetical protein
MVETANGQTHVTSPKQLNNGQMPSAPVEKYRQSTIERNALGGLVSGEIVIWDGDADQLNSYAGLGDFQPNAP